MNLRTSTLHPRLPTATTLPRRAQADGTGSDFSQHLFEVLGATRHFGKGETLIAEGVQVISPTSRPHLATARHISPHLATCPATTAFSELRSSRRADGRGALQLAFHRPFTDLPLTFHFADLPTDLPSRADGRGALPLQRQGRAAPRH